MQIKGIRPENPLFKSPITLLVDDPTPCINPLFYFASQVPPGSADYHYRHKEGNWYFDSDKEYHYPIAKNIDWHFIHEFAFWINSTDVRGKISLTPFPAGLGRVDKSISGFSRDQVRDFVSTVKDEVMKKFDVSPELLTHTNALNLKTMKLLHVSEHDWSQKQKSATLTPYIALSLSILKKTGINATGVTSPCNFGMNAEGEYVKAILEASKKVLGSGVVWYFLYADMQSLNVPHRVMHLDRSRGEFVLSIVGSMGDPFWISQGTDLPKAKWIERAVEPLISKDGNSGRILDLVSSGSCVALVTHWQSLYSNGSRYGLEGLKELVSRINTFKGIKDRVLWMNCSEITRYYGCSASSLFRIIPKEENKGESLIEILTPIPCEDFTFSFESREVPRSVYSNGRKLSKVLGPRVLKRNSWCSTQFGRIVVCLGKQFKPEKNQNSFRCTVRVL